MKTSITAIFLLGVSAAVMATEDPANCSVEHGGLGNTSVGGVGFNVAQAHLGDTVTLLPSLGMFAGACKAVNATGIVYVATGPLTNFMVNVTLNPDGNHSCPADALCSPGPYNLLITAPLVGAGVTSIINSVSGTAKVVKAIENGIGTVKTATDEQLLDSHSTSITIVTPCIQVFKSCGNDYSGTNVAFTGYVLNCGDVTLTNITVVDNRTNTLYNLDNSPLSQPFSLDAGVSVQFKGNFTPNGGETSIATNTITAIGTDTTTIGGPNASVTNTVTAVCQMIMPTNCQCPFLILDEPVKRERYAANRYTIRGYAP